MSTPEIPEPSTLEHGIRELVKNYETRAAHSPEPRAQWADIAQDLRALLAASVESSRRAHLEAVADAVDEDRRLGRGIFADNGPTAGQMIADAQEVLDSLLPREQGPLMRSARKLREGS